VRVTSRVGKKATKLSEFSRAVDQVFEAILGLMATPPRKS
jgi:hypothetical protein